MTTSLINHRSFVRPASLLFSCLLFVACGGSGSNDNDGGAGAGGKAGGAGGKAGGAGGKAGGSVAGSGGGATAGAGGSVGGSGSPPVAGSGGAPVAGKGGSTAGSGGAPVAGSGGAPVAGSGGGSAGKGGGTAGSGGAPVAGSGGGSAGKGGGTAGSGGAPIAGSGGSAAGAGGTPVAGSGGSVAGAGGGTAGAGGGVACNTLDNAAPSHIEQIVMQAPPARATFTGGQIPPGTYFRTATDRYLPAEQPGPDSTIKETISITTGGATVTVQSVLSDSSSDSGAANQRSTYTATAAEQDLTLTRTCPGSNQWTFYYSYTAADSTLKVLDTESGRLATYKRQTGN
jgi:hypothetical protein